MRNFIFLFSLLFFSSSFTTEVFTRKYFVVWNVGQGQWTMWTDSSSCLHFDRGGEFFPQRKSQTLCQQKEQRVFVSHWDWDHVGGIGALKKKSCLEKPPLGRSSKRKEKLVQSFPRCSGNSPKVQTWAPRLSKISNANSQVFKMQNILIPGDSTIREENRWSQEMFLKDVRILILGHHGSRTSTSTALLKNLPQLKQAVSSARWRRYKHPHSDVVLRLKDNHIALLRTEDWGNIWFEM